MVKNTALRILSAFVFAALLFAAVSVLFTSEHFCLDHEKSECRICKEYYSGKIHALEMARVHAFAFFALLFLTILFLAVSKGRNYSLVTMKVKLSD